MQYKGTVSKVSSFNYQGKDLWSFNLQGVQGFFRTGNKKPKVEQGQYVIFDAEPGKNGSFNVDASSISVKAAEAEATGVQVAGGGAKASLSKDDYWTRKEERDSVTQARIERQSCRNSSLEFIKILVGQGAVKFTEKTKPADKVDILEQMLDHYTEQFIDDNAGRKEGRAKEEGVAGGGDEDSQTVGYS
jgi:hypothetical protein